MKQVWEITSSKVLKVNSILVNQTYSKRPMKGLSRKECHSYLLDCISSITPNIRWVFFSCLFHDCRRKRTIVFMMLILVFLALEDVKEQGSSRVVTSLKNVTFGGC